MNWEMSETGSGKLSLGKIDNKEERKNREREIVLHEFSEGSIRRSEEKY